MFNMPVHWGQSARCGPANAKCIRFMYRIGEGKYRIDSMKTALKSMHKYAVFGGEAGGAVGNNGCKYS